MYIKRRQRLAMRDPGADAGNLAEQGDEFRLALYDDPAAAAGDQRCVADELDRVAKTLFGVEKNRAAGEILTLPLGLRKAGTGIADIAALQPPFISLPARGKIALA